MEEHRYEVRIETRFEVVWSKGRLEGVGVLRNLSRSGAWIDEVSVQPPVGARIRIVILEDPRDPLVVDGVVVRGTTLGFGVGIQPPNSDAVRLLLDRLDLPARLDEAR